MSADKIDAVRLRRVAALCLDQASGALSDLLANDVTLALSDLTVTPTQSWAKAAGDRSPTHAARSVESAGQRVAVTQSFFEDFVGEAWVIFPAVLLARAFEPLGYPELREDPIAPPLALDVGALLIGALLGLVCRTLGLRLNYHAPALLALSLSAVSLVDAAASRPRQALAFSYALRLSGAEHHLAIAWLISDANFDALTRRIRAREVTQLLASSDE